MEEKGLPLISDVITFLSSVLLRVSPRFGEFGSWCCLNLPEILSQAKDHFLAQLCKHLDRRARLREKCQLPHWLKL